MKLSRRNLNLGLAFGWIQDPLKQPSRRTITPIFAVNDDGFSGFYTGRYKDESTLRAQIRAYKAAGLDILDWGVTVGGASNFPSNKREMLGDGMDQFPRTGDALAVSTLRALLEKGKSSLEIVLDEAWQVDLKVFVSIRMNPYYGEEAWNGMLSKFMNGKFWWRSGELRIRSQKGTQSPKLSYGYGSVRTHILEYISELAEHKIAGINLDFLRHPEYFGYEKPLQEAFEDQYQLPAQSTSTNDPRWHQIRLGYMNQLAEDTVGKYKNLPALLAAKKIKLAVRVDFEKFAEWGIPIKDWSELGFLSQIIVSRYGLGNQIINIAQIAELSKHSQAKIIIGEEAIVEGKDRTAAQDMLIKNGFMTPIQSIQMTELQYIERAKKWFDAGVAGVHYFNETRLEILKSISEEMKKISLQNMESQ